MLFFLIFKKLLKHKIKKTEYLTFYSFFKKTRRYYNLVFLSLYYCLLNTTFLKKKKIFFSNSSFFNLIFFFLPDFFFKQYKLIFTSGIFLKEFDFFFEIFRDFRKYVLLSLFFKKHVFRFLC